LNRPEPTELPGTKPLNREYTWNNLKERLFRDCPSLGSILSAKQNKTKQNKTKQNKTKQNKTNKAKQSKAKQSKAKQSKAKQNKTKQNKTKQQNKAKQSKAKQSKAKQSKTKQNKTKQPYTIVNAKKCLDTGAYYGCLLRGFASTLLRQMQTLRAKHWYEPRDPNGRVKEGLRS
jgi:flagellar biosynthesis GTPase FlhF